MLVEESPFSAPFTVLIPALLDLSWTSRVYYSFPFALHILIAETPPKPVYMPACPRKMYLK